MKYVASFPGHSHLQPLQYANAEGEGLEDLVISTSGRWRIGTLRVTPNGGSQSCCNSMHPRTTSNSIGKAASILLAQNAGDGST